MMGAGSHAEWETMATAARGRVARLTDVACQGECVAASSGGAVDGDLSGLGREEVEHLVRENRDMTDFELW